MNWTESLRAIPKPAYSNEYVHTRIYHFKQTSVYGPEVIVKQISCRTEEDALNAEREARIVKEHPHPHIYECLGWKRELDPAGGFFVYIFSAPMPMNLAEDMKRRARDELYYREDELWSFHAQLLDAYCHLQRLNIAHRDIKPQNILLDPANNQLKVCDFGFAKRVNPSAASEATLLYTLAYCSPAIRSARLSRDAERVQHNVFKSDVFSLGMTFVHCTMLLLPEPITELPNLQEYIDEELNKIARYSPRWVDELRRMLIVDESLRPDFLQLRPTLPFADDESLPPLPCDPESDQPLSLKVKCGLQYVRVSQQSVDEAPCMISLKAKEQDTEVRAYGMDLMCVIDRSGSMGGGTMELVQRSLTRLLMRLCERDRVSIVVFNDKPERKCPLILCTAEGKVRLQSIIQAITCGGHTSIAQGFTMGLDVLKHRQSPNQSVSVLLFTDGKNNRDGDPTGPCLGALLECDLSKFSVFTFGYRESLDSRLLEVLADRGKGQFHYITKEEQISQVFAYALGSATSVVARNVTVTISNIPGCKVPCNIIKVYSKECANMFILPDIHANEQKELIFLLKPHYLQLPKNIQTPAVQIVLNYIDNGGVEATSSANMDVKFFTSEGHPAGTQDAVVFRHWYRVRGADYLREARDLATQSRFEEANQLLANGIEALRASGYVEVPLVQLVLKDMIQAKELVQSKVTWEQGGDAHFASISYSHFSQSATALTAHYASVQQTAQLSVIPELPDTNKP